MGEQVIGAEFRIGREARQRRGRDSGVPEDDGGDGEVEARGTVGLVFEGAVPDLAVTMKKTGARASAFLASPC